MDHVAEDQMDVLVKVEKIKKEFNLHGLKVGIGVDRIDYTKGILERLLAIERLFERHPEYIGKFVFIQIGSPSRTHIKAYHDFTSEVDQMVERINWKYSQESWTPVLYLKKHFDGPEIIPFYTLADLCIVSSLHDGMNLVAKEYVASKKDDNGVLILSQFAGASKELTDALIINPYAIEEFAGAIHAALIMASAEKMQRMSNLRSGIRENNVYKWAGSIISELINVAAKRTHNISQEATIV
jgi:trehalose 6-phosphate synthase